MSVGDTYVVFCCSGARSSSSSRNVQPASPELEALLQAAAASGQDGADVSMEQLQGLFPFKLDGFQEKAVQQLLEGRSVVVCAPTGARLGLRSMHWWCCLCGFRAVTGRQGMRGCGAAAAGGQERGVVRAHRCAAGIATATCVWALIVVLLVSGRG